MEYLYGTMWTKTSKLFMGPKTVEMELSHMSESLTHPT
jgi:hypothetical protein